MKKFKRTKINSEKYLHKIVHYIHYNPVEARLCFYPEQWLFSSYHAIISNKQTLIKRAEVINWFGDLENFIYCHRCPFDITDID